MRDDAAALVDAALELDVELAIARFADDFDCTMPALTESEGVAIEGGRSPLLDVPFEAVEPVDYAVEGVTVLSGVNSGGKTSSWTSWRSVRPWPTWAARSGGVGPRRPGLLTFTITYYISWPAWLHSSLRPRCGSSATSSRMSTTVRGQRGPRRRRQRSDFGRPSGGTDDRPVMVLVDELESITEPGASAKIMAGILEALGERQDTTISSHTSHATSAQPLKPYSHRRHRGEGAGRRRTTVERSPVKGSSPARRRNSSSRSSPTTVPTMPMGTTVIYSGSSSSDCPRRTDLSLWVKLRKWLSGPRSSVKVMSDDPRPEARRNDTLDVHVFEIDWLPEALKHRDTQWRREVRVPPAVRG